MGEGQGIAGIQEMEEDGGHFSPFPKGLGLCIIQLVVRVLLEVQAGRLRFQVIEGFYLFVHL